MTDAQSERRTMRECRYCSTVFRPHPGFADHQDKCDFNPMNRPHIIGEAIAYYTSKDTRRTDHDDSR